MIHFVIVDMMLGHLNAPDEKKGIRDAGVLASAINLPKQTFEGAELYPTIYYKAAALLRSLAKNHAFVDRNKRTALLATVIFLEDNGLELVATEERLLHFVLRIAKTRNPSLGTISRWLKRNCRKKKPFVARKKFLHEKVRYYYDRLVDFAKNNQDTDQASEGNES